MREADVYKDSTKIVLDLKPDASDCITTDDESLSAQTYSDINDDMRSNGSRNSRSRLGDSQNLEAALAHIAKT